MNFRKKTLLSLFILLILLINSAIPAFAGEEDGLKCEYYKENPGKILEMIVREKNDRQSYGEEPARDIIPDAIEEAPTVKNEPVPEKSQDAVMAEEFINAVRRIGFIDPGDEQALCDAIKMYESLSELAKDMVRDAKERLDDALSIMKYLKREDEKLIQSEERLSVITEKLLYLEGITKDTYTQSLPEELSALEKLLAELSEEETLVLDERLMESEKPASGEFLKKIQEKFTLWQREYDSAFVQPVTDSLYKALSMDLAEGSAALKEKTEDFIMLYESLSPSQKELFGEQTDYEETVSFLKMTASDWYTAENPELLTKILEEISQKEEIAPEDEELILSAKRALDLIDDKSIFPGSLLGSFENAYSRLIIVLEDKKAADGVSSLIDSIGDISLDSEDAVSSARASFSALTEEQKKYVANISLLEEKERELAELKKEKLIAEDISSRIDALGEISSAKQDEITSIRDAYDLLSEKGKAFVSNYDIFTTAEKTLGVILSAEEVSVMISQIGEVNTDKLPLIRKAREKYDSLGDDAKKLVTGLSVLEEAEETLRDHIAAQKADDLIGALPSQATFEREDEIIRAKEYYDSLTDDRKALVKNAGRLNRIYSEMKSMQAVLADYISEHGASSVCTEDFTGNVIIYADFEDLITAKDKDLIASGKSILFTITAFSEEFSYEDINLSILPTEEEEVVFSPFYYIYISKAVAQVSDGGVISDDCFEAAEVPYGAITAEITIPEDMLLPPSDVTRLFTGLISPAYDTAAFERIADIDGNMNTITFTIDRPVNIALSFIDIINPMTGDNATVYIISGLFALCAILLIILRKKNK